MNSRLEGTLHCSASGRAGCIGAVKWMIRFACAGAKGTRSTRCYWADGRVILKQRRPSCTCIQGNEPAARGWHPLNREGGCRAERERSSCSLSRYMVKQD
ncbi:unnamed protein product [Mycena citricolor]|uniref:Uncharacterized protein n=1 Tax=Mycena citricolor TaxID=2018698 RepID=A0AAD2H1B9_9AGAR|nr:unnamed protein product [Mycena citricolor]